MGPFPAVNRNRSRGQEHFSESSEQDRSPEAAAGPRGGEESEAAGFSRESGAGNKPLLLAIRLRCLRPWRDDFRNCLRLAGKDGKVNI